MSANSNSANMSIADRLVQEMKGDRLGQLLTDDDLAGVAKKAINDAFFKEEIQHVGSGYDRKEIRISPVKEAAKEVAQKHCKAIVEAFLSDATVNKAVQTYMAEILPGVITEYAYRHLRDALRQSYDKSTMDLRNVILQAKLPVAFDLPGSSNHGISDTDYSVIAVPHDDIKKDAY